MHNPTLTKAFLASAALVKYRVVRVLANGQVAYATANNHLQLGVTAEVDVPSGQGRRRAP